MADREHQYAVEIAWTGDRGTGTSGYREYDRAHVMTAAGKQELALSSDPAFRGDPTRWDPEELLVGSLSSCHMLWFLHLATEAGIVVREYRDRPTGRMIEDRIGGGRFTEVVLRPHVTVERGDIDQAERLHHAAHERCFVANSVNFPVRCEPTIAPCAAPSAAV